MVKTILKAELKRRFRRPRLRDPKRIAIDEISIGRGHRYLTVVLDPESGAVVFLGDGKSSDALDSFWKRLKRAGAQIEALATDMAPADIRAVREQLPDAVLVFDHFRVVKLMNGKLSDLRRALQRQAETEDEEVLKGTRWLLLKNPKKLDEQKDEEERRAGLLRHSHQPRSPGKDNHEDQALAAESLQLPRSGVLPPSDLRPSRDPLRARRMTARGCKQVKSPKYRSRTPAGDESRETGPYLVPSRELPEEARERDGVSIWELPRLLAKARLEI